MCGCGAKKANEVTATKTKLLAIVGGQAKALMCLALLHGRAASG
jgi:hypothetical protein